MTDLMVINACLHVSTINTFTLDMLPLSKWLFKLINKDGLWQTIIRKKYLSNETIKKSQKKPGVSHFWAGLMNAKLDFLRYGSFHLNNGKQIRFWEDTWLRNFSHQQLYPSLHNIVQKRSDTIPKVLSTIPLNISFCRSLFENNLVLWNDLVLRVMDVQLNDSNDVLKWNLHQNSQYTIHSLYLALINNGVVLRNTRI
jgi:hypothetical protein